ncbi:MAG: histidinol dehydrogenase, partial [Geminicoccaceae bacterium]
MALRPDEGSPDFETSFARLVAERRAQPAEVQIEVAAILDQVAGRGDAALIELTERFDRQRLEPERLRVGEGEIEQALRACAKAELEALEMAAARIRAFHRRQLPQDQLYEDELGVRLGLRWRPIDAAGIYVPGGKAAYPSSVLMNAVPARVAGVRRVVMTVPAPAGVLNPLVLAAARLAEVDEVYRVGGAQAIGALAFGTETIAAVDKIVGPGNAYVAEAKRQVFGRVGIDMIAGPSEILVVADAAQDADWIAADLLSQAEHDELAQAVLITDRAQLADAVEAAVERQLADLPRRAIAAASWHDFGAIVVVRDLGRAPDLVDRVAPEHLELLVADPEAMAHRIQNAGAIFLGAYTPEVIGDYVGGPNHVLPTDRSAR